MPPAPTTILQRRVDIDGDGTFDGYLVGGTFVPLPTAPTTVPLRELDLDKDGKTDAYGVGSNIVQLSLPSTTAEVRNIDTDGNGIADVTAIGDKMVVVPTNSGWKLDPGWAAVIGSTIALISGLGAQVIQRRKPDDDKAAEGLAKVGERLDKLFDHPIVADLDRRINLLASSMAEHPRSSGQLVIVPSKSSEIDPQNIGAWVASDSAPVTAKSPKGPIDSGSEAVVGAWDS